MMLIKLLKTLFSKKSNNQPATVQIIPMSLLKISCESLSKEALKIIQILHDNNYEAFIVGGAVRDFILYQTPKDFDIVTNASPLEVKELFKRKAKLIGHRFPIVHVYMGKKILEVSTFRRHSNEINQQGRITKDNQYGSIHDDANRRDFTCNALYLDPIKQNIHCYHDGLNHLEQKLLIMIGEDIDTRLKEDPIRILRAVRIAAKTDLIIDESLANSIKNNAHLLSNEPIARLFDELIKIIYSKRSYQCFQTLQHFKILPFTHPITKTIAVYTNENDKLLVTNTFKQTDTRLKENQTVSISFVISALLWPVVNQTWKKNKGQGMKPTSALHEATITMANNNRATWNIPNRRLATMIEIWKMQHRLENAKPSQQIEKLLSHPKFRSGYDLLLLRAKSKDANPNKANWWTKIVVSQKNCHNKPCQQQTE